MRLAVLLDQLTAPVPGGTGRYTREMATALASAAGDGDSLTGWTGRLPADKRDAVTLRGIDGPRALPVPAFALARLWPAGLGPVPADTDVVLAPTPLAPPRKKNGPAVVAVIHDAVPWTRPETLTGRGVRFHRQAIVRLVRDADAIVVPTRAVADQLRGAVPMPEDRLTVIGEGVSAAVTTVSAHGYARATQLGLPERFLLMVGTLEPRKNVDVAIRALTEPGAPDLPLVLAGRLGWGSVDPYQLARDAGLPEGRVVPLGALSDADLAVVLSRAAAVLVPSRDEGFGLPVVEAMAHGIPVVVSDAPALVETAGGAAEVTPVGDAAALALAAAKASDPARREAYAQAGRAVAATHTWQAAAAAMWALLRAVT